MINFIPFTDTLSSKFYELNIAWLNKLFLLYDNGNYSDQYTGNGNVSRAVEYQLDTILMTAEKVWEYAHPDSLFTPSIGGVQRFPNENTLIDFGNLQLKGLGSIVTEVTPDNEVVFQLEYSNGSNLYIAHKFDWFFDSSIPRCTDLYACNYNEEATEDDQSCTFVDGICDTCEDGVVIDNDIDDDGICDDDSVTPINAP